MRFAIKRLTRSDLTLFEVQFRRQNAGNQKALNLNRDVLIDVLFPGAAALAGGRPVRFPCELRIFGPAGVARPRVVMRKVIAAGGTQKNWRLNGETVAADPDAPDPDRYDRLREGDLAVLAFEGSEFPTALNMVLLASETQADADLHRDLDAWLGGRRMRALSTEELRALTAAAHPEHPIRELLDEELDDALEDAALGSVVALEKLRARGIRRTSHEALAEARDRVERIGRDGETMVAGHLKAERDGGRIESFVWESETNATHPFDFTIVRTGGQAVRVEVKSTAGPHDRAMIFSHAELAHAAGLEPTEVWRISRMADGKADLRAASGLPDVARRVVERAADFGDGIRPNAWTIEPEALGEWIDLGEITIDDVSEE
jgi:hypothetical protein